MGVGVSVSGSRVSFVIISCIGSVFFYGNTSFFIKSFFRFLFGRFLASVPYVVTYVVGGVFFGHRGNIKITAILGLATLTGQRGTITHSTLAMANNTR